MLRIKLALVIGGIALAVYAYQEYRLATVAKETPQTISCADLSAKGPGDNANIVLTDAFVCQGSFVTETNKKNNSKWTKLWVPVVPSDGEYMQKIREMITPDGKLDGPLPVPQNIKVILKSSKVSNKAELEAMASSETLTGLVTNEIESIGSKEREILQRYYPGTDFTKCYILDHDRKPAGMAQVAGLGGGSAALCLLGLGWIVVGSRSKA